MYTMPGENKKSVFVYEPLAVICGYANRILIVDNLGLYVINKHSGAIDERSRPSAEDQARGHVMPAVAAGQRKEDWR